MARQIDDVLRKFREMLGPKATKNDRAQVLCSKCRQAYSTSAQNERKKIEKWVCGSCILSKPKSDKTKKKMRKAALEPARRAANSKRNSGKNNSFFGKKHTVESLSKMRGRRWSQEARSKFSIRVSREIADGKRSAVIKGRKQWRISTKTGERNYADSGYELRRMEFLDECQDVKYWTKNHGIVLRWGPEQRRYIPDFVVELQDGRRLLQEVKGWVRDSEEQRFKEDVARKYCHEHEMEFSVLFEEQLRTLQP